MDLREVGSGWMELTQDRCLCPPVTSIPPILIWNKSLVVEPEVSTLKISKSIIKHCLETDVSIFRIKVYLHKVQCHIILPSQWRDFYDHGDKTAGSIKQEFLDQMTFIYCSFRQFWWFGEHENVIFFFVFVLKVSKLEPVHLLWCRAGEIFTHYICYQSCLRFRGIMLMDSGSY